MTRILRKFLFGGGLIAAFWLKAATPTGAGDVDLSFDPGSGLYGGVHCIAVQPDGKILIGGGFVTIKGLVRHGIARLNSDGSGDASFKPASPTGNGRP